MDELIMVRATRTYNLFFIKMYQSIIFDILHRYI